MTNGGLPRAAQPVPQDGLAGCAAVPHGRLAALRQQRGRAQQPGPGPLAEGAGARPQHQHLDIRRQVLALDVQHMCMRKVADVGQ